MLFAIGMVFQSTGPLRDPTVCFPQMLCLTQISIHRSLAGPDIYHLPHQLIVHISIHRSLAGPDGRKR